MRRSTVSPIAQTELEQYVDTLVTQIASLERTIGIFINSVTDLISRPAPDLARGFGRFRQWTEWSAHGSRSRREAKAGSCPPPCVPLLRFPDYGDDILRSPAPLTSKTAGGDTGTPAGAPTMIWNCQQAGHFGLLRGLLAPSDGGASAHAQDARDHKKPDSYEKPKN